MHVHLCVCVGRWSCEYCGVHVWYVWVVCVSVVRVCVCSYALVCVVCVMWCGVWVHVSWVPVARACGAGV